MFQNSIINYIFPWLSYLVFGDRLNMVNQLRLVYLKTKILGTITGLILDGVINVWGRNISFLFKLRETKMD